MTKKDIMKTLIIYYHPYEGSYCHSILGAVKTGLKKGGHACKVIDLDIDGFDPVMRGKDLKAFGEAGRGEDILTTDVDPIVLRYKKRLEWAERIVMIFPIWWMTMPAMMKGFIDKVIFPGVAYDMEGGRLKSRLKNLRQVTVISTMNTPADIYRDMFGNSLEGSLIKGTFNQIGIHDVEWISLNMVKQSGQEVRKMWLEELEDKFI
jgi:putative NADPH-quinone reductase